MGLLPTKRGDKKMRKENAVIDASNVLHLEAPRQQKPRIKTIYAVIDAVKASGREPILVVEAATLSTVGDPENLENLLAESFVLSIPDGSDTNRAVLETAEQRNAIVVSNNIYSDYWSEYPWVELCRLPVALVDGHVRLLEQRFRKAS
jgi:Zc3h12a-like Ribonuclease NYN domain